MKKIALLRSLEVQQAIPFLNELEERAGGAELRLFYTDGDCGPTDFSGIAEKLPNDVSARELADRLLEWGADGVISLSLPDENTVRDSVVKAILEPHGVPVLVSAPDTVRVLSDKWATKQLLEQYGLRTPVAIALDGDLLNGRGLRMPAYPDYVRWKANDIGYPLMAKPLWDCMGHGIEFLQGPMSLEAYLESPHEGNALLESCIAGEICSVEIVGANGRYLVQPLSWMGLAGGPVEFAFGQVRYSTARSEADNSFLATATSLTALLTDLRVEGAVCVDMIYADGLFWILEINPRVSGATGLGVVASGINTYGCLLDILLGRWADRMDGVSVANNVAIQFPTLTSDSESLQIARASLDVVRANVFTVDGVEHPNMLIRVDPTRLKTFPEDLAAINARISLTSEAIAGALFALTAKLAASKELTAGVA